MAELPKKRAIKFLTVEEVDNLLSKVRGYRDKAMFLVIYFHGLRAAEVGLLQVDDWKKDTQRLYVHRVKNGREAQFKVHEKVAKAIQGWLKVRGVEEGPLFLSRNGNAISRRQLDTLMKKYGSIAGLPQGFSHVHTLRHSIATHMIAKKIPIRSVQEWLGHRNISSTLVYADMTQEALDETAKDFYEEKKIIKVDWKKNRGNV